MANHSEFVELANELITEDGTLVTLQEFGTNAGDINKPWRGSDQPDIVKEYKLVPCVFIAPIGKDLGIIVQDKDLLKRTSKVAIVPSVAEGIESKITKIKEKDGKIWNVIWSQCLKPADQSIIYIFGVAR